MTQKTISNTQNRQLHCQLLNLFHATNKKRHSNNKGPKIWCNFQRFVTLFLFKRSGKSLRRFVNEFHESKWIDWLGFAELPAKSTIHDWYKAADFRPILRAQTRILRKQVHLLSIDGTGLDSWQRSRHYERRIGNPNMPYAKLDILIDIESKAIVDHSLKIKNRHDVIAAEQMLKRTPFSGVCLADKGYDSEPLHEIARENNIELKAPVRNWERKRPRGRFRRECAKGIENYSMRNTVESVIHSLKSVYVPNLRSRLWFMKKKEMNLAVLVYNIEKMMNQNVRKLIIFFRIIIYSPDIP